MAPYKKIFLVSTKNSWVEVTEDHSLLDEKAQEIKPNECKSDTVLFHSYPTGYNGVEWPDRPQNSSEEKMFIDGYIYANSKKMVILYILKYQLKVMIYGLKFKMQLIILL